MSKYVLFFLLLFSCQLLSQTYDEPIDTTDHYGLRLYEQSARIPAEVLNEDKVIIDSVMYSLIVWTDTLQFVLITDTSITQDALVFKVSNYANGTGTFTTTAETCSLTVSGTIDSNDTFIATPKGAAITSNDVLGVEIIEPSTVVVHRPASGTSGLKFTWYWIRRY